MTKTSHPCRFCTGKTPKYVCGKDFSLLAHLDEDAQSYGLCPSVVQDAVGSGDEVSINLLSEELITMMEERSLLQIEKGAAVRAGGAIPASLVRKLTRSMIDACEDVDHFPISILELIRIQLMGKRRWLTNYKTGLSVEIGVEDLPTIDRKTRAAMYLAAYPNASNRQVGKLIDVDHTTVRRWRMEAQFQNSIAKWSKLRNISRLFPPP